MEWSKRGENRPGLLVKLRPSGPWRIGPASGARTRVDSLLHSDTLYSALTHAMRGLGRLEHWLEVTARAQGGPQVLCSSMFPFHGETLYVTPPKHVWPPPPSVRVHYAGARCVPMSVVESIFAGRPLEDERWNVDGASGCLVSAGRGGPFRVELRGSAAVDRLNGGAAPFQTACLEFANKAGLWFAVSFADEIARDQWREPLRGAIRLLADSGFGGERSRGWGRSHKPEIRDGALPQLIYKGAARANGAHWALSMIAPGAGDAIDFGKGNYSTAVRGGYVDSAEGAGAAKKLLRLIEEGSVLHADSIQGSAPNVAPEGFPHPVYRAGWAFTIPVPVEAPKILETAPPSSEAQETTPIGVEDVEERVIEEALAEEVPPADAVEEAAEVGMHLVDSEPEVAELGSIPGLDVTALEEALITPEGPIAPSLDEPDDAQLLADATPVTGAAAPEEIPTPDEELERLEVDDPGGPDDDIAPPMNDPGPMEPPFREPEDLTPIDPDPGSEPEPDTGPGPDHPVVPEETPE